jgi:hypothetical protein
MSDPNAPSWLVQDNATSAPSTTSNSTADKPKKSGGVFKMFSKEAAAAHVEKAATDHAVSKAKNITNYPDDGFTPAWATASTYTPPSDIESGGAKKAVDPSASASAAKEPEKLDIDPETLKSIKFYHIILRIMYMLSSSLMATSAGFSLVLQTNVSAAFFAIYVIFFCTLLCCFEVGLNVSVHPSYMTENDVYVNHLEFSFITSFQFV